MRHAPFADFSRAIETVLPDRESIDVSIVMPCLNEAACLPICIANAREALAMIAESFGLVGEIVVADNGSTDGSQAVAVAEGARVVPVAERGYGAALIGGGYGALGRFIVFGDADGSYDFRESVPMIERLIAGADLCMGSRFKGGIAPGAMPWKNRYIGNPVLTGILNLMFRPGISDAHCGLRAVTGDAFRRLRLSGSGMEFASEMVIKAALQKLDIAEVPATLSPDLRDREPHLRPWRDGWRHLRYLLMLSPTWIFTLPAAAGALAALIVFAGALLNAFVPGLGLSFFGNYWVIAASALAGISHLAFILSMTGHLHGIKAGYRRSGAGTALLGRIVTLETMLISGLALIGAGFATLAVVALSWSARDFSATYSVLPAVGGTLLVTLGIQNIFGGFLLAIVGGNEARFLDGPSPALRVAR
jgi:glycosyltransferase involved in cell wall biosynthesis